jgi:hypothetical protein
MFALRFRPKLLLAVCAVVFVSALLAVLLGGNNLKACAEQYAVYSAYIQDGLTGDSHSLGDRRGTVLIADYATMASELNGTQQLRFTVGSLLNLRRRTAPPSLSLILELALKNLRRHKLNSRFAISADYHLLDTVSLSSPNRYERFPRSYGYLTLSSVAFSFDLTEALFYTEHICGLCGGGEYVLMRKNDGRWSIVNRYSRWVS